MKRLLRIIFATEIWLAGHVGAVGAYWSASASRRLRKLSGEHSENGIRPKVAADNGTAS